MPITLPLAPPGFYDLPRALLCIWPLMNWFCILIEKLGNPPTIYSVWNKDKSPVLLFVYLKFFQLSVVIQSHCIAITYMKNVQTNRLVKINERQYFFLKRIKTFYKFYPSHTYTLANIRFFLQRKNSLIILPLSWNSLNNMDKCWS